MKYETKRLILRTIKEDEADKLLYYVERNKNFLEKWEPLRDNDYYSLNKQSEIIISDNISLKNKTGIRLYIFNKGEDRIIGSVALSNIVYGCFLSCHLGYKLDELEINNGKMTEAINKVVKIAFKDFKLHRIEANIIPENIPSIRVIKKSGFVEEGLSKNYLKINDKWQDHIHYVLLNKDLE